MWLLVFFDLPVGTKIQRRVATQFRQRLLNDGFIMLQYSVYARFMQGNDRAEKHAQLLEQQVPKGGNIRVLQVTELQYARMIHLAGSPRRNEAIRGDQLVLF
jgi:CRISPR-associated protein Cas2